MALTAQGTKLYRGTGTGSPETFAAVTNLQSFSGPTTTRDEIETTTLDSTAKEYMLALKDHGEMTFDGLFVPTDTTQQDIFDDLDSSTARNWKVVFSDTVTTAAFAARVKNAQFSGAQNDVVKMSLTLRITGDITWTYDS